MFYRVSNAIIAPDLVKDLGLNAESLGTLGGAFFYSFAFFQIPMGFLLDKIGPRKVITLFSLTGAAGAFIFASAHTMSVALLGRVLIGIGMATGLMGALKVFVLRFPLRQFSTLSGTIISIGTVGSVLATSPLAYLAMTIGWRMTFICAGVATTLLSFLALWVLNDKAPCENTPPPSSHVDQDMTAPELVRFILGNLSFWQIGVMAFFRYGTFVALQGLWLGPYLMGVKGFHSIETGNMLMMLSVGMIVGSPVAGQLADRLFQSVKITVLFGVGCYGILLIPLTGIFTITHPAAYSVLFFMIGFFSGFGQLAYSHVKDLYPLNISATVIGGINFFVMAGGGIFMSFLGKIIEVFSTKAGSPSLYAYHLSFLICFLGVAISLIFYAFSKGKKD
jgi:MFS family permease